MHVPNRMNSWLVTAFGLLLTVVTFVVTYLLDVFSIAGVNPLAAVPATLFSVVALQLAHSWQAERELQRVAGYSDRAIEALKDYLHITQLGSPASAIEYVLGRLPALDEVQNTSFNLVSEAERVEEVLYESRQYDELPKRLVDHVKRGGRWKDIGDERARVRLEGLEAEVLGASPEGKSKSRRSRYQYRILARDEPQMNFMLLQYPNGSREVLFNWDFRRAGADPVVLLSRDRDVVEMFATQFDLLWAISESP